MESQGAVCLCDSAELQLYVQHVQITAAPKEVASVVLGLVSTKRGRVLHLCLYLLHLEEGHLCPLSLQMTEELILMHPVPSQRFIYVPINKLVSTFVADLLHFFHSKWFITIQ